MDDSWTDRPAARIERTDWSKLRGRLGELLSLTLDMLVIGSVSLILCALCGMTDQVTMTAMGIAVYISCKHFGHLRREIAALREQLALSTTEPGWRSSRADALDGGTNGPNDEGMISCRRWETGRR